MFSAKEVHKIIIVEFYNILEKKHGIRIRKFLKCFSLGLWIFYIISPIGTTYAQSENIMENILVESESMALEINTLKNKLYVANTHFDSISVINTTDDENNLIKIIEVGKTPSDIVINKKTQKIFILNSGSNDIHIIDDENAAIEKQIEFSENSEIRKMFVDVNKNILYVSSTKTNTIFVIDLKNYEIIETIKIISSPYAIVNNAEKNEIYVTSLNEAYVYVLNENNYEIIKKIKVGSQPNKIILNQLTDELLVTSQIENTIDVIDLDKKIVTQTISAGIEPIDFGIDKFTNRAYIVNWSSGKISIINLHNNILLDEIDLGKSLSDISIDSIRDRAYISNFENNSVYVIKLTGKDQLVNRGCFIATAVYGSILSPEVQLLREIRDVKLANTEYGFAFLKNFNSVYYSFSPFVSKTIAESDILISLTQILITPGIMILKIMEFSESTNESVLLFGSLSIIMLFTLYFLFPFLILKKFVKKLQRKNYSLI